MTDILVPAADPFDIDWANPDYTDVLEFRADALDRLRANPRTLAALKQYYSTHWADFITEWGMTVDPRKAEGKYSPFILFPRQVEFIDWVYERFQAGERGLAEKSRDVGFTWLCAAAASTCWLFVPDSVIGFGSRKKELVDNGDHDPDSIFWKVRTFIDYLPQDFLPPNHEYGRKSMVVPNVANRSVIKGEIGDEIGRGGRSSLYFVDEFAHLEHADMAESALSANTDCRLYVSTVNGPGNLFYRLRNHLPSRLIFIFDWKEDPRKRLDPANPPDQEIWYRKQREELLPTTLASQVDRDYNSTQANGFVDQTALLAATKRRVSSIVQPEQTGWRIGVDAAGQGNDEIVIWARRGRISLPVETYKKLDGVQLAGIIERKCRALILTAPLELIAIERDGPGGSCVDQLKYGPFASITVGVHTGAKLKDGRNFNLRAYLHEEAHTYLVESECAIPDDATFITQASAIQATSKGGLLLIESKDEYRARFALGRTKAQKAASRSPDRWDAFMLTFTPVRARPLKTLNPNMDPFAQRAPSWRAQDAVLGY